MQIKDSEKCANHDLNANAISYIITLEKRIASLEKQNHKLMAKFFILEEGLATKGAIDLVHRLKGVDLE